MKQTYNGSCHCGNVRFRFQSESINKGLRCNCSICIRKNAIMSKHYVSPEDFELLTDISKLSIYHWNDKDVNHYFCPVCGIYPFHDSVYDPGKFRVNLGCVEELDPHSLELDLFDGRNLL